MNPVLAPPPAVSVVMPTYNRSALLGRALHSIVGQDWRDLEVLVVDDGSEEDLQPVVDAVGDGRVRLLRGPGRQGAAAARNLGCREAHAPWIAFADSDDIWLPGKLRAQMRRAATAPDDVAVVYTAFLRRDASGEKRFPRQGEAGDAVLEGDLHRALLERNFITTGAAMVRASAFRDAGGFDESMPRYQDWELWVRLARRHRFAFVPDVTVVQEEQPDSISRDPAKRVEGRRLLMRKTRLDMARYPGMRDEQLVAVGRSLLSSARPWVGRRMLLAAWARRPTRGSLLREALGPAA